MTIRKRKFITIQPRSSLYHPGGRAGTLPLSRKVGGQGRSSTKSIVAFCFGALAILFTLSFLQYSDKPVLIPFFSGVSSGNQQHGGEQDKPNPAVEIDSITASVPSTKVGDMKILLYVTTHMSPEHVWYLKACWPEAMKHSLILGSADVAIYLNSPLDQRKDDKEVLTEAFKQNHLDIYERDNPGWQEGAMAALSDATKEGWFSGYDWVIRLNPDVIIRDESFLVDTMENDPDATGLFINCNHRGGIKIHTDFFAIKPAVLKPDAFLQTAHGLELEEEEEEVVSAEDVFTQDIREVILEKNNHRWIPGANPATPDCRAGEEKSLTDSPITHKHFRWDHDDDAWSQNYTCPVPFV